MLITAIFDPKKAWKSFRREVLTIKGGVFLLLLVGCGFVVHYVDSCSSKSDASKTTSAINPVKSPVMQVSGNAAATQNNNYSQKNFSGNAIEENQGTVNNYNIQHVENVYQSITTNIIVLTTNVTILADPVLFAWFELFNAREIDTLSSFTNAAFTTHDYNEAFTKSASLISTLESGPSSVESAFTPQHKAAIYSMAAFSADMTDTNPEAAYGYALKAYNLSKNEQTIFTLAVTAHNFGRTIFNSNGDCLKALELERKAIGIYELNSKPLDSGMPTNFASIWYIGASLAADKCGLLEEARLYAVRAFIVNHSKKSEAILMKTFHDSGLNVAILAATTNSVTQNPLKIFIYSTNGQIIEWNEFSK